MTATANTFILGAGVEWGTTFVTLVTFVILIILLKKFAWGPLKEVMDKRERDINKDIDDAEQAKINAQKLEEENRKTLKETQDEVQKILDDAKIQARKQHEEIIHEANEKLMVWLKLLKVKLIVKKNAISDINNQVSELSVLIASKVLRKEISEQDQKELVEKYLKEAGDK